MHVNLCSTMTLPKATPFSSSAKSTSLDFPPNRLYLLFHIYSYISILCHYLFSFHTCQSNPSARTIHSKALISDLTSFFFHECQNHMAITGSIARLANSAESRFTLCARDVSVYTASATGQQTGHRAKASVLHWLYFTKRAIFMKNYCLIIIIIIRNKSGGTVQSSYHVNKPPHNK